MNKTNNQIVYVSDEYKTKFNSVLTINETFDFLEKAEAVLGVPVSWEDDGYFVIHGTIKSNLNIEHQLLKLSIKDN